MHDALFGWRRLLHPEATADYWRPEVSDVLTAEWALAAMIDDLLRLLRLTPRLNAAEVVARLSRAVNPG